MTQKDLQDSIVSDLKTLFAHSRMKNSKGVEREIQIFPQYLPVLESEDDMPPEAYVEVVLMGGDIPTEQDKETIKVVMVICVYDKDVNRQGYRDALHIKNEIYRHFATRDIVCKKFQVLYPIRWEMGNGDTHPYYFAGVELSFEAPVIRKETAV